MHAIHFDVAVPTYYQQALGLDAPRQVHQQIQRVAIGIVQAFEDQHERLGAGQATSPLIAASNAREVRCARGRCQLPTDMAYTHWGYGRWEPDLSAPQT
jgi:hypothetical protein